jgi:hypothetical protein
MEPDQSKQFIICWCTEGLECVVPATDILNNELLDILSDRKNTKPLSFILNYLILRARANLHRHYEIYQITATDGISETDLTELFNQNPQYAADLIRDRGIKIYSDRLPLGKQIIT